MNSILFIYIFSLFVITSPNFVFKIPIRSYWISIAIHAVIFSCILYFTYDIVNRDVVESAVVNNDSEQDDGNGQTMDGQTMDGQTTVIVERPGAESGADSVQIKQNTANIDILQKQQNQSVLDNANDIVQLAKTFADNAEVSANNAATYAIQAASQLNSASNSASVDAATGSASTTTAGSTPTGGATGAATGSASTTTAGSTPTGGATGAATGSASTTTAGSTPTGDATGAGTGDGTAATGDGSTTTVIDIGRSNTNTKTVQLPHDSMTVSPIPVNTQNPSWNDRFSVTVNGRTLTVRRLDYSGGWGQPLQLSATTTTSGAPAGSTSTDEPARCWRKMPQACNNNLTEAGSGGTGVVWFVDPGPQTTSACDARIVAFNDYCIPPGQSVSAANGVETHWGQKPAAGSTTPPAEFTLALQNLPNTVFYGRFITAGAVGSVPAQDVILLSNTEWIYFMQDSLWIKMVSNLNNNIGKYNNKLTQTVLALKETNYEAYASAVKAAWNNPIGQNDGYHVRVDAPAEQ